jgi:3-deoxy-D-manno-octulosonic-acid transferase
MAAIPVIRRCIQARPIVNILMTTSTVTAHSLLEKCLPPGVLLQVWVSGLILFVPYYHHFALLRTDAR